jgi:4-alpha-glucanotransferase
LDRRSSGVLMHITSLPSPHGIGDLGPSAYRFADFLAGSNQSYWQILPLNPTRTFNANSPYSSFSAFAGNPLLISLEKMVTDGYLDKSALQAQPKFTDDRVDFEAVAPYKYGILRRAYNGYRESLSSDREFAQFCSDHDSWLSPFALWVALKVRFGGVPWNLWPVKLRDRYPEAMAEWTEKLADRIQAERFLQFVFYKQWSKLRQYCRERDLSIIGDLPIYVSHDSADVWLHPEAFRLNGSKAPAAVSGVPPDYFSETGQLWGNPVYDWSVLKKTGFAWWLDRLEHNLKLYDLFRLDHFRGFVAYWEVSAGEETAISGKWVAAPHDDFFNEVANRLGRLPMIAEDLGTITPDVFDVMKKHRFPETVWFTRARTTTIQLMVGTRLKQPKTSASAYRITSGAPLRLTLSTGISFAWR